VTNREIPARIADLVASKAPARGRIGVLGLSYKPDTPVIEESQAILITQILLQRGFEVQAYDPSAMEAARQLFGERVQFMDSAQACIRGADVVLIATPWKQFKTPDYGTNGTPTCPTVIDCWGLLDGATKKLSSVIRIGINRPVDFADGKEWQRFDSKMEIADELEV
jgi:UDPglucose 6-dehydrogenase